jgi:uncharacterized protein YaaR (DUF327 family)
MVARSMKNVQEFTRAFTIIKLIQNKLGNLIRIAEDGEEEIGVFGECIGLQLTDQMTQIIKLGNILAASKKLQFLSEGNTIY